MTINMVGSGTLQLRPLLTLFARNHNRVHKRNMTIICESLLSPALVFVNLIGQKRGEEDWRSWALPSRDGTSPTFTNPCECHYHSLISVAAECEREYTHREGTPSTVPSPKVSTLPGGEILLGPRFLKGIFPPGGDIFGEFPNPQMVSENFPS